MPFLSFGDCLVQCSGQDEAQSRYNQLNTIDVSESVSSDISSFITGEDTEKEDE